MNKNIGIYNGNWRGGTRPSLDDVPFELSPVQLLQSRLNVAHMLICQGTPAMIADGQRKVLEVVAEVWHRLYELEVQS